MLWAMKHRSANRSAGRDAATTVRIIAGQLRGRRLNVPPEGTRPTADRIRETLFNWLAGDIRGARCLDLFAGSGALGVEALSRGARSVVFVEQQADIARCLGDQLVEWGVRAAEIITADALQLDYRESGPFDVVFLDPPFADWEASGVCRRLEESGALAPAALIYLEASKRTGLPELPGNWTIVRDKTAGQVRYALVQRESEQTATME